MLSAPAIRRPKPTVRPPPVPACPRRIVSVLTVPAPTSARRTQRWYGTASTVISRPTPDLSRATRRAPRGAVNAVGWSVSSRSSSASSNRVRSRSGSPSRICRAASSGARRLRTPVPANRPVGSTPGVPSSSVSRGSAPGRTSAAGSLLPSSKVTVRGAGPGGRASVPVSSRGGRYRSNCVSSGARSPGSAGSGSGSVIPAISRSHSRYGSEASGAGSGSGAGLGSGAGSGSGAGLRPVAGLGSGAGIRASK